MRAKKSMRKTSKEVDEKRRSRQTKSKRANTGADLESETMEISRVVSAIMAAAEEGEEEADGITQDDDNGTSDAESTSYAVDGMSCVDYDDDDDDIDENSAHESDDSSNQDDDDDVSTRESDSDNEESDEAPENESADDNKASTRSRRALLPSSTKRLGRKGKLAGQHDKSKSKNKSKKWGLKRLLGPKQRADAKVFALEGNDDDLSSSSPASVSNADDYTRSQSHVSSVVQDIDHTILGGDTAEDNTICTASRVSIIEGVSTAPGGNDDDEESTVAFEISTTFPGATSFIRGLGLGPKLLGYDSANDDKEEEEKDIIKDKNGNALGVIEEEEVDDTRNVPTSPPLSITVSQSTDGPTRTGATCTSNANLNASIGIAPLKPSDRTTSECRRPIGSPEKISIQREDSNINADDVLVPKRVPFKSLGRMPNKATKSPPKRKPRRDHVIVSVFSSDTGPSKPATCATSSPNPFGMCADASSEDDWYNCDTNGYIAIVPATEEDGTWTANFDEAFGFREPDGQKDCDLDDDNTKVENAQPTSSGGSLPSTGTVGPVLEQTNPSTPTVRKSKDLPPSPTSVIAASDGKNTNMEAHTDEQDAIPDDLKKQVDELDQLISKMSYDMKLLSSIITEQQGQEQSIPQPISPEIGDSVRHRSLVDDIVDDIEEKGESNEIMTHAVDSNVEVPLEITFSVGPSKTKDYDLSDDLSIKPTVAIESVPVNNATDRASESKPNNDEFTKKSAPRAPTSLLSKLFKSRKSPESSSRSKNASLPLRTKRSVFFRRSNKPQASRDADHSSVACAEQSVADTVLPTPEKSETFGDAIISTANALLDQAADYAFPQEDDEAEVVGNKKRSKAKKTQKKKEEKAKAKKTSSNLIKSKSRSMSRSSSKKRSTFFLKHKNDRSDRICRIFGDCTDLYNDICNFQELSCMCQDFLCDAQEEATLAVCRVDYAVKKSIRNFGEQCIEIADGEEDYGKNKKSKKSKVVILY